MLKDRLGFFWAEVLIVLKMANCFRDFESQLSLICESTHPQGHFFLTDELVGGIDIVIGLDNQFCISKKWKEGLVFLLV